MSVLVTGAAGFIGSHTVAQLIREGERVLALDKDPMPDAFSLYGDQLTYIRGDLTDRADIFRLVVNYRPEEIIHLGAVLGDFCETNPTKGIDINFNSTVALLDAACAVGVGRFILASSISVYAAGLREPVGEDDIKVPATIYGQTKLACEHLLDWYRKSAGVSTAALRFPWVFGPGRKNGITAEWSSKLLDKIARKEKISVSNPDETGNWLYVRDAVKALMILRRIRELPRTVYNIMGWELSIRDVLVRAIELYPEALCVFEENGVCLSPYPARYSDDDARKDIGWEPDYSIDSAIREHINTIAAETS